MSEDEREEKISRQDQADWDYYMDIGQREEEIEDFATLLEEYGKKESIPEETIKKPKITKSSITRQQSQSQIDKGLESRLQKGKLPIERIYDLHGLREQQAYEALEKFILRSFQSKCRCLLVITGKGKKKQQENWIEEPKGVLKRKLPDWLAHKKFEPYILKVMSAHQKHGGEGAYYIYLKRNH